MASSDVSEAVPTERVRRAVATVASDRAYIKSAHIVEELDLDDPSRAVRSYIGRELRDLADEGVLEQWGSDRAHGGTTYAVADLEALDVPEVRADGGQVTRRPLIDGRAQWVAWLVWAGGGGLAFAAAWLGRWAFMIVGWAVAFAGMAAAISFDPDLTWRDLL